MRKRPPLATKIRLALLGVLALSGGAAKAWQNQDIGSPGTAGSFSESGGVYTLQGSGTFAWADEKFHFVHTTLHGNGTGNGSITVKLTDHTSPSNFGQVGIMIRDNLTSNANQYALTRDPWGDLRFRYNQKTVVTGSGGWGYSAANYENKYLPIWLRLERNGNTITAKFSPDGENWTTLASGTEVPLPNECYMGMFVYSGTMNANAEAKFANVTTEGTAPITSPWYAEDIGSVGIPGDARQTIVPTNQFEIKGSGTGFYGDEDSGHFVYQEVTGNHEIVARVASQSGATDLTAPAALMMRDDADPASRNALISVSGGNVVKFQAHPNASDTTSIVMGPGGTETSYSSPVWLKLVRSGSSVSGYYSVDGWNWTIVGSASVPMNSMVYSGMAVSSKSNSQLKTVVFDRVSVGEVSSAPPATFPIMTDITSGLTLIEEIDAGQVAPDYQVPANVSTTATILNRTARVVGLTDSQGELLASATNAATIAYVMGAGLVEAGKPYILEIEYPDDVPRSMYITNRGADHYRGFATGKAVGDARMQFVEPTVESLDYPHSGEWKKHRQLFYCLERFQEVVGVRDPEPNCRPRTPEDGFHVAITRMKFMNDVRSEGIAIGKIRLYRVDDIEALYAPLNYPPPNLPRRSIFWREEMADQLLQTGTHGPSSNMIAISDPLDWHVQKMRMAKVLGINTYAKDLLEFGHNQGWVSDNPNYFAQNAQPPGHDVWNRMVPKATEEGIALFPYYEYKGGIGTYSGLGNERRAEKLYHGYEDHKVCDNTAMYECVWWTEGHNADVTDPDTLDDAKRVLDLTIGDMRNLATFNGAWFRMRGCQLPMSFSDATLARFKNENPGDSEIQTASRATMIESYESEEKTLYNKYLNWWFEKRKAFLIALRDHLRNTHGIKDAQILFTPYTSEAVPNLHGVGQHYGHAGVVTDDNLSTFWTPFFDSLTPSYEKYIWQPTTYASVTSWTAGFTSLYAYVLQNQRPINDPSSYNAEQFHSSPNADPERYTSVDGVSMSFPIGRMFTVEDKPLLESFRSGSGLTVVRHYPLNEDDVVNLPQGQPSPFGGQLGYLSVDCDRAGDHLMLMQARALAKADPLHIGYLAGSSFSPGFPEVMRRFNQAFLAVPALTTTLVTGSAAPSNPAVVMRYVTTPSQGTYIYVVNTSMDQESATLTLPGTGNTVKELVTNQVLSSKDLNLTLDSAELRAYWVGDSGYAGTEVFNQTFQSSGTLSSYVSSSSPSIGQFNDIGINGSMTGWSINGNALQLQHDGSGAAGFTRHTDLDGSPTMIAVEFDVTMTNLNTWSPAWNFTFGNLTGNGPYGGTPSYQVLSATLTAHGFGTHEGVRRVRFRLNYEEVYAGPYDADATHHVAWFINTSGEERYYTGPDGASYPLGDLRMDLWVNGVRELTDMTPTSGYNSRALTDFYTSIEQNATYKFDNFVIRRLYPQ